MYNFLETLSCWDWFGLAIVFLILEIIFVTGAVFMWLGIAAAVTGLWLLLLPAISWQLQLVVFSAMSVISIILWRKLAARFQSDAPTVILNRRGSNYIGKAYVLRTPIQNGYGEINIDDTTWKIEGEDMPADTKIKVVALEGMILRVEKLS